MNEAHLQMARRQLVRFGCAALVLAMTVVILTWLISGDLEGETVLVGAIFALLLGGLAVLAGPRPRLALGLLAALLGLLVTADVFAYGLGEIGSVAYLLPVLLMACGLGFWPGLAAAALASALVWLAALGAAQGWLQPFTPYQLSHLTFNAPVLMVVFFLCAFLVGFWQRALNRAVSVPSASTSDVERA